LGFRVQPYFGLDFFKVAVAQIVDSIYRARIGVQANVLHQLSAAFTQIAEISYHVFFRQTAAAVHSDKGSLRAIPEPVHW
jgi:hypothetical protein